MSEDKYENKSELSVWTLLMSVHFLFELSFMHTKTKKINFSLESGFALITWTSWQRTWELIACFVTLRWC